MRLRGMMAGPESYITTETGWMISAENPSKVDVHLVEELLGGPPQRNDTLIQAVGDSLFGFWLFLASRDPRLIVLSRNDSAGRMAAHAVGLFDQPSASLCLLVSERKDGERRRHVSAFGGTSMLTALQDHVAEWTALGSPSIDRLQITAYPTAAETRARETLGQERYRVSFDWGATESR